MPKHTRSRKSKKRSTSKRSHTSIPRSIKHRGTKDTYTFTEIVDAGQLIYNGSVGAGQIGAVWIMNLQNFPAYAALGSAFEFVRLEKCSISYLPKANMQLNIPVYTGVPGVYKQFSSVSGTLITAIDQVPLIGANSLTPGSESTCWIPQPTETGVTLAKPYTFVGSAGQAPVSYVRGLQRSKETELDKTVKQSFYPAFYDLLMDVPNATGTMGGSSGTCFNRIIKKWVNCSRLSNASSGPGGPTTTVGPTYYGPIFCLDVNQPDQSGTDSIPLYDVRMRYTMSFKRLRGF